MTTYRINPATGISRKIVQVCYLAILTSFLLIGCSKSSPDPSGSNNGNGSGNGNGNGNGNGTGGGNGNGGGSGSGTTLTYINDTYTTISIVANNQTQTIAPGGSLAYTGTAGSSFNATATTSGKTSNGAQVGLQLSWTLSNTFPSSGNFSTKLDAGSNYFFLKIINKSGLAMTKLYVNYGLQPQTLDNITIPNDGLTYNIGYYSAYTNSNARAENGNTYWYWASLNLPGTLNQATILTGN